MTTEFDDYYRRFITAALVVLSLFWGAALQAQETAGLPSYVIEEFGTPPQIPQGPLPASLKSSVQVVFVEGSVYETYAFGVCSFEVKEIANANGE